MADMLDGARAKLAWGRIHAELLDAEVVRLYGPEAGAPYTLGKSLNKNKDCVRFWVKTIDERPGNLALILGDALYNFRSALDHVAYQLARHTQGRAPRSMVAFPIATNAARFARPEVVEMLQEIAPEHRTIIENFQPYRRVFTGDVAHPFAVLSAACNKDKHRLLHILMLTNHKMSVTPLPSNCEVIGWAAAPGVVDRPLKPNMELFRVMIRVTGPDPKVGALITGGAKFALDDGSGIGIHTRLRHIGECVEEVIGTFASVLGV